MPRITYQDFDVLFARTVNKGEYSAGVFGASGDASVTFEIADIIAPSAAPETDDNLVNRRIKFAAPIGKPENYFFARRAAPNFDEAKRLGAILFESVFKKSLLTAFELKREQLPDRKTFLRIRLHLTNVPELATLPWEYLYNAESSHFYAQLPGTPVVRYLDIAESIKELTVEGALRMLVVSAAPRETQRLNVELELQKLQEALAPLIAGNLITLEHLKNATPDALQKKLQDNLENTPFHIFHFIGHGVFDRTTGAGFLLFENEDGTGRLVGGDVLGAILNGQDLRLVVLNSCEGAISANSNAYAGIAQTLCRKALIPAVIAMQFEISDAAAIKFAGNFYGALTKDFPVEAALAEARKAILIEKPDEVEWATPVLYMRASDGRMRIGTNSGVQINHTTSPAVVETAAVLNRNDAPPELIAHYNEVIEAVRDGQMVPFIGLDANLFGRLSAPETWKRADGLPGSAELAYHLSRSFKYPLKDLPDLARIAQYSNAANRLGELFKKISEIFGGDANQPTALHSTIAGLAARAATEAKNADSTFLRTKDSLRRRFLVVTTGYDNSFETAFKSRVRDFHVVSYMARGAQRGKFLHVKYIAAESVAEIYIASPNDYNGLADGNPVILKLPGTVENIEPRFAITEDDYFDYLSNRELTGLLPAVLTGKLKASNHLFLGYSPCSWNMRALLYRIWEEQRLSYRASWAVLSEAETMDETFWRACNVTVVRSGLSEYIAGLNAAAKAA